MKKLLLVAALTIVTAVQAQEPEKKKSAPPRTRGQERAINETGVSVKSDPKKSAKTKSSNSTAPKEEKQVEKAKEAKKPE